MGVVLKAHDPAIERDVAIKLLADHLASNATALSRFLAEAKAIRFAFLRLMTLLFIAFIRSVEHRQIQVFQRLSLWSNSEHTFAYV